MLIWQTAFLVSFFFFYFFISIVLLDVFVGCGDHVPLYNLFNVILTLKGHNFSNRDFADFFTFLSIWNCYLQFRKRINFFCLFFKI